MRWQLYVHRSLVSLSLDSRWMGLFNLLGSCQHRPCSTPLQLHFGCSETYRWRHDCFVHFFIQSVITAADTSAKLFRLHFGPWVGSDSRQCIYISDPTINHNAKYVCFLYNGWVEFGGCRGQCKDCTANPTFSYLSAQSGGAICFTPTIRVLLCV